MIQIIKEDITKLVDDTGVDFKDFNIKTNIDSAYDPCNVCKKELLLFQEYFKAEIEVFRPSYLDEDNIKSVVINKNDFLKLNN